MDDAEATRLDETPEATYFGTLSYPVKPRELGLAACGLSGLNARDRAQDHRCTT